MVTFIVGLLLGILAGILIARNNIKKVNKIVAEAEEAAKIIAGSARSMGIEVKE